MKKQNLAFYVGEYEKGFLAASRAEPYFCVAGDSKDAVIQKALNAWAFYLQCEDGARKPVVSRSEPFRGMNRAFTPSEVIFAVA